MTHDSQQPWDLAPDHFVSPATWKGPLQLAVEVVEPLGKDGREIGQRNLGKADGAVDQPKATAHLRPVLHQRRPGIFCLISKDQNI